MIERTGRGRVSITPRGREVLGSGIQRIDLNYLNQYPEIRAFRSPAPSKDPVGGTSDEEVLTPEESLESNYQILRDQLAQDLLERLKQVSPQFFETVVVDLLLAMGYGGSRNDVVQAVGRSGDDGVDGIIKEDELGLDSIYVQAKRWDGSVSRPTVQAFAGSLEGQRARKGVFITTSTFTKEAHEYVSRIEKRIVLIDGERLAALMIEHGVGVATVRTFAVKRIDNDYFDTE
jgi:restriction system protein